jgi:hypothetical protein
MSGDFADDRVRNAEGHQARWHSATLADRCFVLSSGVSPLDYMVLFSSVSAVSKAKSIMSPHVAADVYGAPPHSGRGGWTWYTGCGSSTHDNIKVVAQGAVRSGLTLPWWHM